MLWRFSLDPYICSQLIQKFVQTNTVESSFPLDEEALNLSVQYEQIEDEGEPPFTLKELQDAIPPHCFQPSVWRSLSY